MILLIEDNPIDAEAITRAFASAVADQEVKWCETGDEAIAYLDSIAEDRSMDQQGLPRLIVLDLNLPGMDGREVLRILKTSEKFKAIPVVVLSSTTSPVEIEKVYAQGANTLMTKPISLATLTEMIQFTSKYWFNIAIAPKSSYP